MTPAFKDIDVEALARKGQRIYEKVKRKYQPRYNGQFLAIEVDSGDVFKATETVKAIEAAKKKYPDKIFFVVKIGFSAVEILSRLELEPA